MHSRTAAPPPTQDMPEGVTNILFLSMGHPCYELLVEATLPTTNVALINWDADTDGASLRHSY